MKKCLFKFPLWLITVALLTIGLATTSCSDNDDKEPPAPDIELNPSASPLVGRWHHSHETGYEEVTFNDNGSGRLVYVDHSVPEDNDDETFCYTYNASTGSIKITVGDETEYWHVDELGDGFIILDGTRYTRM